ncbi:MAG: MogA/MoaB family molybdenum cofactor biosynthesis protein [Armatimonadota bacterium]|nr:MogA/MoaB family molybdenum cofactor biosynthesis protein [Armatimonadota bacterium]MDR7427169.1 MogA/MoaB family molybdenum cofactor biosynthesis protein [Armatimonadota bacterium]MDR7473548.1 MogA/MoaB family molybdenum cofactor biosynthesis protein [Armatimonadota bacterium]MDR7539973.1 MogA/MoaB family molybdenum cofactor biosynthesis protein [Armatimonadota bacterium]
MATLAGRRVAVLTVSDSVSAGRQPDTSGDAIVEMLAAARAVVAARDVLPDNREAIAARLRAYADDLKVDLVLTTGGSGVAPRDVTPEATLDVVQRLVPGLPEAARARTQDASPLAILSRGVAGIRGRTLILNLPGSPRGAREWLEVLAPVLPHALELLGEQPPPWGVPHRP